MTAEFFVERRLAPRRKVTGGVRSDRAVAVSVRVLDIGPSGILVMSSMAFEVGQCARLTTRFGDRAIDADVEVRRVLAPRDGSGTYRIGARFISLSEEARRAMKQFLADSTQ